MDNSNAEATGILMHSKQDAEGAAPGVMEALPPCPECNGKGIAKEAQGSAWPFPCFACNGTGKVLGVDHAPSGAGEGFHSVGTVNCHVSGELDLAIGTELFVRSAKACEFCSGTGRYGDGAHDGSGRWIECPHCTSSVGGLPEVLKGGVSKAAMSAQEAHASFGHLAHKDGVSGPDDWPWPVGLVALGEVIRCLRETGRFVDEEGELTNALDELMQRVSARGMAFPDGGQTAPDPDCICRGNWRAIVKEVEPLIGRYYRRQRDGVVFSFFGVVHAEDDYYYGMWEKTAGLYLISCVGPIDYGFELVEPGYVAGVALPAEPSREWLLNMLVRVTHHPGAVDELSELWGPVVAAELSARMAADGVLGTGSAAGHTTAEFSNLSNQAHGYGMALPVGGQQ